jgi:hypothetical protein
MICKTFRDHLLVSRLKNVQGQGSAGEQHDLEREQRKKGHEVSNIAGAQDRAGCPIVRHLPFGIAGFAP